jgi:hypothetical protein
MINKEMNDLDKKSKEPATKPNEIGGIYFSSSIKITDPNTNEVLLHKRGDN